MIVVKTNPAIFLDRDGVLNADSGYVYRVEDLVVLPHVGDGLARLQARGYLLIVVTNQSGIARGYFSLQQVQGFHQALSATLWQGWSVTITDYFVCPHHPDGLIAEFAHKCNCRKPNPGLVELAVKKWGIDLNGSFLIGDKPSDIGLAVNVGIPGIQISETRYGVSPGAVFQAPNLMAAADFILDYKQGISPLT